MNTHRRAYRRTTARQRIPKRIPKPVSQPVESLQVAEQDLIPGKRYTIYRTHQQYELFRARFVNLYHYETIQAGNPPTTQMAKTIHFDCIDYERGSLCRLSGYAKSPISFVFFKTNPLCPTMFTTH